MFRAMRTRLDQYSDITASEECQKNDKKKRTGGITFLAKLIETTIFTAVRQEKKWKMY